MPGSPATKHFQTCGFALLHMSRQTGCIALQCVGDSVLVACRLCLANRYTPLAQSLTRNDYSCVSPVNYCGTGGILNGAGIWVLSL